MVGRAVRPVGDVRVTVEVQVSVLCDVLLAAGDRPLPGFCLAKERHLPRCCRSTQSIRELAVESPRRAGAASLGCGVLAGSGAEVARPLARTARLATAHAGPVGLRVVRDKTEPIGDVAAGLEMTDLLLHQDPALESRPGHLVLR